MSVRRSMASRSWVAPGLAAALSIAAGVLIVASVAGQPTPGLAQTVSGEREKKDPADARKDVISGVKAFEKGKMDEAIALLTKGLKSGGLPAADTAKALYYRGLSNRRSGRAAQAISDLTSAVWLKDGLSEDERKTALENRSAAYAEAGLKDPGMADPATGGKASGSAQVASKTGSSSSSSSSTSSSSSGSSGGPLSGVGNFFSGLFGGGSSPAEASTGDAAAETPGLETASTGSSAPASSVSAWNSTTQKQAPAKAAPSQQWEAAATPVKQAAVRPEAAPAAPASQKKLTGRYEVQVAAVRSREEAERLALDVTRKHASVLGSRVAEIEETVFGNMGTFYRVSIGPFAKAGDTASLCKALKAGGYDCMVAKN